LLDDYNDDDDINAGQPFAKPSSGSEFLGFGVFLCFVFFSLLSNCGSVYCSKFVLS